MKIYLVGSLRNPKVRCVATLLRLEGHDVFDDWHASGPEADDIWQRYETERGRSYKEALDAPFATHAFEFDCAHLEDSDAVVMLMPTGKSGHMEFCWAVRGGALGYVLFLDGEPERWDMMYKFAHGVFFDVPSLIEELR